MSCLLYGPALTTIYDHWEDHSLDYIDLCRQSDVSAFQHIVYTAVSESLASESGSRRSAMNAANKNAGEMIDTLKLSYNRARQSVITQEITEIVSGAEAL